MTNIDAIIDKLRREPTHLFSLRHNCIGKSFRLKKFGHSLDVKVRVVIALCLAQNKRFWFLPPTVPTFHGWAEVDGKRIELAHPLSDTNSLNTYDIDIVPLIATRVIL